MAGMGLQGGTARCYDFWMDFLKCVDEETAPMLNMRKERCLFWMQDYKECLHREKFRLRELLIERERRKQEKEKLAAPKRGAGCTSNHRAQQRNRRQLDAFASFLVRSAAFECQIQHPVLV